MPYPNPRATDMNSRQSQGRSFIAGQSGDGANRRTSQSLSGIPQQTVTAQGLSDILQGTFGVRGPEDTLLVVNKALSGQLEELYNSGGAHGTAFSTVPRIDLPPPGEGGHNEGSGAEGEGGGGGDFGYTPGQIPPDNIPPGGERLPWGATIYGNNTKIPPERVAQFAYWAGFRGETLVEVVAIAKRESMYMPYIRAVNAASKDDSYGLMMINMIKSAHPNATDAEYLQMLGVPGTDPNLLREPQVNMNAAFAMYQRAGNSLRPWGGYKGKENTYNTNLVEARQVVAQAEHLGYFRTRPTGWSGSGSSGGSSGGGSGGAVGGSWASVGNSASVNSPSELEYAGGLILRHPNFWCAKEGTGGWADALRQGSKASPHGVAKGPNGGTMLMPNLMNLLWFILENGFIISQCWGTVVNKRKSGGNLSNHAYGGAIDIGAMGIASENKVFGVGSRNDWNRVGDKLFNILQTLPKSTWADEYGWHTRRNYGSAGFHTYTDPNPNHYHFGFSKDHAGALVAPLKQRSMSALRTTAARPTSSRGQRLA